MRLLIKMDNFDLKHALSLFLCHLDASSSTISSLKSLHQKCKWSTTDKHCLLNQLSFLLSDQHHCESVAVHFAPLLLDLLHRFPNTNKFAHDLFCSLSQLVALYPEVAEYVYTHYEQHFDPFSLLDASTDLRPFAKKPRLNVDSVSLDGQRDRLVRLLRAALSYLLFNAEWFVTAWNWSTLFEHVHQSDPEIVYLALHSIRVITQMPDNEFTQLLHQNLTNEQITMLRFQHAPLFAERSLVIPIQSYASQSPKSILDPQDYQSDVVCVAGVLLNRHFSTKESILSDQRVDTHVLYSSFQNCLHDLASAVAFNQPVLIEGPVGCGKTSLVEYLASQIGRHEAPALIKVQMSDQIDRKMLIGSYHCTEIPGQFVWLPGPLTKALTEGGWLLFEDIDCAPSEVISDLVAILKTHRLDSIAGCSFIAGQVKPSFRVFFTRRVQSSTTSESLMELTTTDSDLTISHLTDQDVVYRLCTKVRVTQPSRDELRQVISTLWPNLTVFVDKLLHMYTFVQNEVPHHRSSRVVTMRDLIKLCARLSKVFTNRTNKAYHMLLDVCDCLLAHIPDCAVRLKLAEKLGTQFNFTATEVHAVCSTRKPSAQINEDSLTIGRSTIVKHASSGVRPIGAQSVFAFNLRSLCTLEQLASAVEADESVLLVGETGTGKTSSVQFLANHLNKQLLVINLNQQTDSTDIVGGYKPVQFSFVATKLKAQFEQWFALTFSVDKNLDFLSKLNQTFDQQRWKNYLRLLNHITDSALSKRELDRTVREGWRLLKHKLNSLAGRQLQRFLAFEFFEGQLIHAIRDGHWVLLDEINLAQTETLQLLTYLLDRANRNILLFEKGDQQLISRHPDFRLFACMNPCTDVGKRDLPLGIRNLFTEIFVPEPTLKSDLRILTESYIGNLVRPETVERIVELYLKLRRECRQTLNGYASGPYYSLRTFCRALRVASANPCRNVQKTLYEAFCMSFLTQLDQKSTEYVQELISTHLFGNEKVNVHRMRIPCPSNQHMQLDDVANYWLPIGSIEPKVDEMYILTDSVRENLRNVMRVISIGSTYPILLQGETSVGKTSMIEWLARRTGNVCYRINNHEHIDLQEYVGGYAVDSNGRLVFREGLLVQAMRHGHWIILDELNLASTEVLEALNRLLDDNRELFIPETQELVKAHPRFLLFATQNPPETYAGRKMLSRAFRNRFIELRFDELPSDQLEIILHRRCSVPKSYAGKMVDVFRELRNRRSASGVFAGRSGFVTLRDLFRWGERYRRHSQTDQQFFDWQMYLAEEGHMLIAGRVRRPDEAIVVRQILEKTFKCELDEQRLFDRHFEQLLLNSELPPQFTHLVWTRNAKRLAVLLFQALSYDEPVLLVGETGGGKTTLCELFAYLHGKKLYTVNCHLGTESSDFIGGLRPKRSTDSEEEPTGKDSAMFEWVDGPLVEAMQQGATFLSDEISLADDSVLERLNSLLEPQRKLLLAEKHASTGSEGVQLVANPDFRFVATMNPGGDYAKKELSPALRNRFTEIWCACQFERDDVIAIITHNLVDSLKSSAEQIAACLCDFITWFNAQCIVKSDYSIRDVLTLVNFINQVQKTAVALDAPKATYHSLIMRYLDAIGSSAVVSHQTSEHLHRQALEMCSVLVCRLFNCDSTKLDVFDCNPDPSKYFGNQGFFIERGHDCDQADTHASTNKYELEAPSVRSNCVRLLRCLQLGRSILLEGPPGVGKSSVIAALARASGHRLIRINLSEQTDICDLFGADLPVEGAVGQFAWRDGPLLQALKQNDTWLLLDELNLASQSVLEGLNACLDHRGQIYVPELNRTFEVNKQRTRIFATQNPHAQGGGRKGLPRSLLNRFMTLYIDQLSHEDMQFILHTVHPTLPVQLVGHMVQFNQRLQSMLTLNLLSKHSVAWEFNLRDLDRWCELVEVDLTHIVGPSTDPALLFDKYLPYLNKHVQLIYVNRFRHSEDRLLVWSEFEQVFKTTRCDLPPAIRVLPSHVQVGQVILQRSGHIAAADRRVLLSSQLTSLESVMRCVQMRWMAIMVGSGDSLKSETVHALAQLTGHRLRLLHVNSEMDSMELLGGFEQKDFVRRLKSFETTIWHLICRVIRRELLLNTNQSHVAIQKLFTTWARRDACADSDSFTVNECVMFQSKLKSIEDCLRQLSATVTVSKESVESELIHQQLLRVSTHIHELSTELREAQSLNGNGTFEWIDSVLLEAIKNGEWLLVDDANLCAASVLDRINSLLEPNGSLTINEQGCIDGQLPVVRPHPDFRLFLTMNPINGELSRAMRNRGIEIYVPDQSFDCLTAVCRTLDLGPQVTGDQLLLSMKQHFRSLTFANLSSSKFLAYILLCLNLKSSFQDDTALSSESLMQTDADESEQVFNLTSMLSDVSFTAFRQLLLTADEINDGTVATSLVFENISLEQLELLRSDIVHASSMDQYIDDFVFQKLINTRRQMLTDNSISQTLPLDLRNSLVFMQQFAADRHRSADYNDRLNVWTLHLLLQRFKMIVSEQMQQNRTDAIDSLYSIGQSEQNVLVYQTLLPKQLAPLLTCLVDTFFSLNIRQTDSINDAELINLSNKLDYLVQLIQLCLRPFTVKDAALMDDCRTMWVIALQKDVITDLAQVFRSDVLAQLKQDINLCLKIEDYLHQKHYAKLIRKYSFDWLPFDAQSAVYYRQLWTAMVEFSRHDPLAQLNQRSLIQHLSELYGQYILRQYDSVVALNSDFEYTFRQIQDATRQIKYDKSEEETSDKDLIDKFTNLTRCFDANLHALHQTLFFTLELEPLANPESALANCVKQLASSSQVLVNPLHQLLYAHTSTQKFDILLHHHLDLMRIYDVKHIFNLVNWHDFCAQTFERNEPITSQQYMWNSDMFSANCTPIFSLILAKNLVSNTLRVGYLQYQEKQIEKIIETVFTNYFHLFGGSLDDHRSHDHLIRQWIDQIISYCGEISAYDESVQRMKQLLQGESGSGWFGNDFLHAQLALQACTMFAPSGLIDPFDRDRCKRLLQSNRRQHVQDEIDARRHFNRRLHGHSDLSTLEQHPIIQLQSQLVQKLSVKVDRKAEAHCFRPVPSAYHSLTNEIAFFIKNVLFDEKSTLMMNYLQQSEAGNEIDRSPEMRETVSNHALTMSKRIKFFVLDLLSKYACYYDLLGNFLLSASILQNSMARIGWQLQRITDHSLPSLIQPLFRFCNFEPNRTAALLLNLLQRDDFIDWLRETRGGLQCNLALMYKCALIEINNAFALGVDSNVTVDIMNRLIMRFLETWAREQTRREQEQAEKDALYLYKERKQPKAEEIVNDEQQLNDAIERQFPDHTNMYADLMEVSANDLNRKDLDQMDHDYLNESNRSFEMSLDSKIVLDVIELHRQIICTVSQGQKLQANFLSSYQQRYAVLSEVLEVKGPMFDRSLDSLLLDGHMIVYEHIKREILTSNEQNTRFNIYNDFSITEARSCADALNRLKDKLIANLQHPYFNEHVTLRRLLRIVFRIQALRVTQPLIKYLTGLEFILQVSQDWEEVAPKEFKLVNELEYVKELIVRWRQIELQGYDNCLDNVLKRIRNKEMLKWWFHFYSIISEMLLTKNKTNQNDEDKDLQRVALNNLYVSLKQFIGECSIGEFGGRLALVENFVMHVKCVDPLHASLPVLCNVHNYYSQFVERVQARVEQHRKELDREIRERVKIIKWKKVNYFGLKNLITKSHRIIMRNMNRFEMALDEKAILNFFDDSSVFVGKRRANWTLNMPNYRLQLIQDLPIADQKWLDNADTLFAHLNQSPRLVRRCVQLIHATFERSDMLSRNCEQLNEHVNEIVKEVLFLQQLAVDLSITDTDRRRKSIKAITNQKDKRLNELLKFLKKIGLSAQKGLNNVDELNKEWLQSCGHFAPNNDVSTTIQSEINFVNRYFYESYSRFMYFSDICQMPSGDLDLQKVAKMKGFALHLLLKVFQQRARLTGQLQHLLTLNSCVQRFEHTDDEEALPASHTNFAVDHITKSTVQLKIYLIQVRQLLIGLRSQSTALIDQLDSYGLIRFQERIDDLVAQIESIDCKSYMALFNYNVDQLNRLLIQLNTITNSIRKELQPFVDQFRAQDTNCILYSLIEFCHQLQNDNDLCLQKLSTIQTESDESCSPAQLDSICGRIDDLVRMSLLGVQQVYRFVDEAQFEAKPDQPDELLTELCKLDRIWKQFLCEPICESAGELFELIGQEKHYRSDQLQRIKRCLNVARVHLLNYKTSFEHFFNLSLAAHRDLNKLLYVILGIFNELCKKGFCIPPETNEDDSKQDKSDAKFNDVENGGIGEGQGSKDVSDEIDNLNQIEGLKKDDKTDAEDDPDEPKNEESKEENGIQMEEDFEGDEFDKQRDEEDQDAKNDEESEEEADDQKGDVNNNEETLDEKLWAGDEEEPNKKEGEDEMREEDTKNGSEEVQNELGAKDEQPRDSNNDKQQKAMQSKDDVEKMEDEEEQSKDYEGEQLDDNKLEMNQQNEAAGDEAGDEAQEADELPDDLELDKDEPDNAAGEDESDRESLDEQCNDEPDDAEDVEMNESSELNPDAEKNDADEAEVSDKANDEQPQVKPDNETEPDGEPEDESADNAPNKMETNVNDHQHQMQFNDDIKQSNESTEDTVPSEEQQEEDVGLSESKAKIVQNETSHFLSSQPEQSTTESHEDAISKPEDGANRQEEQRRLSCKDDVTKRRRVLDSSEVKREEPTTNERQSSPDQNPQVDSTLYRHIEQDEAGDDDVVDKARDQDLQPDYRPNEEPQPEAEEESAKNDQKTMDTSFEPLPEDEEATEPSHRKKKSDSDREQRDQGKTDPTTVDSANADSLSDSNDPRMLVQTLTAEQGPQSTFHTDLSTVQDRSDHLVQLIERISLVQAQPELSDDVRSEASEAWRECEQIVAPLVNELTQQLQLILEPTRMSRFKGDYKTGKRLNMRKIISYIASQYRKDKIWMRRTKPNKREYQIILALDDSASMKDNKTKSLAFESLILLGKLPFIS